jgi:hypothetical protein
MMGLKSVPAGAIFRTRPISNPDQLLRGVFAWQMSGPHPTRYSNKLLKSLSSSGMVIFLGLILVLSPVLGCGKKTLPRAPEKPGQALASPENLQAQVSGTRLTLTWTHAVDPVRAVLKPRYFEVSMAIPEDCEGCPFVFKPVGQTSMPETVFQMPLTGTGPWYFRVQAAGDHDARSEYSKTVVVGDRQ